MYVVGESKVVVIAGKDEAVVLERLIPSHDVIPKCGCHVPFVGPDLGPVSESHSGECNQDDWNI